MSASESSPRTSHLHESIEQLIAETVERSQSSLEAEKTRLITALTTALDEIEMSQHALSRAATVLHVALNTDTPASLAQSITESSRTEVEAELLPEEEVISEELAVLATEDRGPHELDVIAHDVGIAHATGLQTLLRSRPEVNSAQTREFVNGELRLQLDLTSALDVNALTKWLKEHGGQIVTSTQSVIEIRFEAAD